MNNIIMKVINLDSGWHALSPTPLIASVTISCPPTNTAPVHFIGDGGSVVPWQQGEWHEFKNVDLSTIKVTGTAGDIITVIGGTW